MSKNYPARTSAGWYLAPMGRLEWLETILKVGAIFFGISAFFSSAPYEINIRLSAMRFAQIAILGIMSLGLIGAIFERWNQREIGAMIFVVFNNLGHWGLLIAILGGLSSSLFVIAFSALMLTGDLVKFIFFATTAYTIRNAPRSFVLTVIMLFAVGYALILGLELII
jgi:hypothetical protein